MLSRGLRTIIIGAGQIASGYDSPSSNEVLTHAHAIGISEKFELIGFYDIDKCVAQKASQKWGVPVVDDLSSVDNIEVVCCAVSDVFHYDVMKEVSGWPNLKAVVCEKPLADTFEKARDLGYTYDRLQVPVFVNYTRRFLPEFSEIKQWINIKAGELIAGNCVYGKGLTHNGSHMINLLQYLLGNFSVGDVHGKTIDYNEDDPSVEFDLIKDKSKISLRTVPCDIATVFEMDLFFRNGRVRLNDAESTIEYYTIRDSAEYPGYRNYVYERLVEIDRSQAILSLYSNVYNVITGVTDIIKSGIQDSVETLRICSGVKRKVDRCRV